MEPKNFPCRLSMAIPQQNNARVSITSFLNEKGFRFDMGAKTLCDRQGDVPNIRVEFIGASTENITTDLIIIRANDTPSLNKSNLTAIFNISDVDAICYAQRKADIGKRMLEAEFVRRLQPRAEKTRYSDMACAMA